MRTDTTHSWNLLDPTKDYPDVDLNGTGINLRLSVSRHTGRNVGIFTGGIPVNALTQRQDRIRSRQLRDGRWRWQHRRRVLIWWAVAFWACAPVWAATDPPSAADVYKNRCASCHGVDGENPKLLRIFPDLPNFKDPNWQKVHTSTALRNVILHGGKDGMPGFENDLDGVTADQMVQYLRQFAPKKEGRRRASRRLHRPPQSTTRTSVRGATAPMDGTPNCTLCFPRCLTSPALNGKPRTPCLG